MTSEKLKFGTKMFFKSKKRESSINWTNLTDLSQLDTIVEQSKSGPVVIFKHSTRCSISATSLRRLESDWSDTDIGDTPRYYLDLIRHRDISDEIASRFGVIHESPQVLLIKEGQCIYHKSHWEIAFDELKEQAA